MSGTRAISIAAACLACAFSANLALANPLDVIGIQVGMPAADAQAVVKRHNPALRLEVRRGAVGPYGLIANPPLKPAPTGEMETIGFDVSPLPGAPVVIAVARQVFFTGSNKPAREQVFAALRKKYGSEPSQLMDQPVFIWYFDDAGRPMARQGLCDPAAMVGVGDPVTLLGRTAAYVMTTANHAEPERLARACGAYVIAMLNPDVANKDVLSSFKVIAADEKLRASKVKEAINYFSSQDAARRAQETDKAKARGAPKI